MVTINLCDDDKRKYDLKVDVTINTVYKVIVDALLMYDKTLLLNAMSDKLKHYFMTTFTISMKELDNYFTYNHEKQMFVESMKRHGYIIKYHTMYKVTEDLKDILIKSEPDKETLFGINENLLFNDLLGYDAIKYIKNSKNFQKSDFINITGLQKKKAIKTLDYMIYGGFLTRNGTTYCITNKFISKVRQYMDLFKEMDGAI